MNFLSRIVGGRRHLRDDSRRSLLILPLRRGIAFLTPLCLHPSSMMDRLFTFHRLTRVKSSLREISMLFISRCSRCPREQRAERTDGNFLEIELKNMKVLQRYFFVNLSLFMKMINSKFSKMENTNGDKWKSILFLFFRDS